MSKDAFQIRQLADELQLPQTGKQSIVVTDDENTKVVLFAFAAGDGLKEHFAPLPAIIQIIKGEAELTVGEEAAAGKPGTWIQMAAKTPHSIADDRPYPNRRPCSCHAWQPIHPRPTHRSRWRIAGRLWG